MPDIDNAKTVADFEAIKRQAQEGIDRLTKRFAKPGDILQESGDQLHFVVKNNGKFDFIPISLKCGDNSGSYLNKVYNSGGCWLNAETGEIVGSWKNLGQFKDYFRKA